MVDAKLRYAKMYKPSPPKPTEKTSLSPSSYMVNDSYKNTQLPAPRFYISKYKHSNFIAQAEKS